MDEKIKPGKTDADKGAESRGATPAAQDRTLSATRSFVEQQSRIRDRDLAVPLGEKFGDYQILRLLGKGGMGEVYEADHLPSGRRVALKVLGRALGSREDRERFLQEGKLAAQVNHPSCVYVYGSEEILGTPVISMELVRGGTLKDLLKERGRIKPEVAVDLILQVVRGLEAMHATGVLHRDIKPSNCFIDAEGNAKIGDFGLSISTLARPAKDMTASGSFAGTPAFASPEQIRGEDLDVRSDIYSVGATLYCLLAGSPPFDEADLGKLVRRILEEPPAPLKSLPGNVPKGLAAIVMRCLEKDRSSRYPGYAELKRALRPYSSAAMEPAGLAFRSSARFLDLVFLAGSSLVVGLALNALFPFRDESFVLVGGLLFLLYFALLEGLRGTTVGKAIHGIRVIGPDRAAPGVPRSLLRATIFLVLVIALGRWAGGQLRYLPWGEELEKSPFPIAYLFYPALGGLLLTTARKKNGFAGIHDLASMTRVVTASPAEERAWASAGDRVVLPVTRQTFGPYVVIERLRATQDGELLLGYDEKLERKIWIHVQPSGTAPLSETRRDIARPARLRWINGRRSGETNWDAFEAPEGRPFLRLDSKRDSWIRIRGWLAEIIEEFKLGSKDGSLPSHLGLDRLWISATGRVKILDFPAPGLDPGLTIPAAGWTTRDPGLQAVMRNVLKHAALVALEGVPRGLADAAKGTPSIPLPLQARSFIEMLAAEKETSLSALSEQLESEADRPARLSKLRLKRAAAILCCLFPLAWLDLLSLLPKAADLESLLRWSLALGYLGILAPVLALAFRGGVLLSAMNLAVVNSDGSPVSRGKAFSRSLIGWTPMILLGILPSVWNRTVIFDPLAPDKIPGLELPVGPSLFLLSVLAAGAVWSIVTPEQGPNDRLAGTYVVPR